MLNNYSGELYEITPMFCFPQEYVKLYNDYLPVLVSSNQNYTEQISSAIKIYGDINPELIYFYLNYIQNKIDPNSGSDYFYKNFIDIKRIYENRFNDWIVRLKKEILLKNDNEKVIDFCTSYLDEFLDDEITSVQVKDLDSMTDSNLRDFLAVKYYTLDLYLKYDKKENYELKRKGLEDLKLSGFEDMVIHPSNYNKNDVSQMVLSWYLFENKNDGCREASDIVLNVLHYYYTNKNMFHQLELDGGYSFQMDYTFLKDDSYGTNVYSPSDVQHNFDMHSIGLSLKYKMFLSEYLSSFNLLDIQLSAGYGIINKSITGPQYGYWHKNVDGVSNRNELIEFTTNEIKLNGSEYLSLGITLPVFYIGETVSIDAGARAVLLNTNYELSYDYEYRLFESEFTGPKILATESGSASNKKLSSLSILYSPELSFGFYLKNPYSIHLMTTLNMIALEFGINL
jgi:hypothetical protein